MDTIVEQSPSDRQGKGRYYAIGDIHGMLSKLEVLLDTIPMDKDLDTLVFLGDYLDRGPEPRRVIQRIIGLMEDGYDVIALRGNHEALFLKLLEGNYDYWSYRTGFYGAPTLKDYSYYLNFVYREGAGAEPDPRSHYFYEDEEGHRLAVPFSHLRFLESLQFYHETEDFIFVHAGLRPGVPLREQSERDLLWIREKFLTSVASFGKVVVHGHSVEEQPEVTDTRIGIDTGAGYGGKLTCVCLPEVKFYFA